ncbi:MAG: hypothetical protein JW902_02745, partial [Syntrophaceae bacterium]|nr:hypothetical protein [Syntrophaceae bacterium]
MTHKKRISQFLLITLMVALFLGLTTPATFATEKKDPEMIPANFSDLADKVRPGVVNIQTMKTIVGGGPVFRHFFGNPFEG